MPAIETAFRGLVPCTSCNHSIDGHDAKGCGDPSCFCELDRDAAIAETFGVTGAEYDAYWASRGQKIG